MPKDQVIASLVRKEVNEETHHREVNKRIRPRMLVEHCRNNINHRTKDIPDRPNIRERFRADILLAPIESKA